MHLGSPVRRCLRRDAATHFSIGPASGMRSQPLPLNLVRGLPPEPLLADKPARAQVLDQDGTTQEAAAEGRL